MPDQVLYEARSRYATWKNTVWSGAFAALSAALFYAGWSGLGWFPDEESLSIEAHRSICYFLSAIFFFLAVMGFYSIRLPGRVVPPGITAEEAERLGYHDVISSDAMDLRGHQALSTGMGKSDIEDSLFAGITPIFHGDPNAPHLAPLSARDAAGFTGPGVAIPTKSPGRVRDLGLLAVSPTLIRDSLTSTDPVITTSSSSSILSSPRSPIPATPPSVRDLLATPPSANTRMMARVGLFPWTSPRPVHGLQAGTTSPLVPSTLFDGTDLKYATSYREVSDKKKDISQYPLQDPRSDTETTLLSSRLLTRLGLSNQMPDLIEGIRRWMTGRILQPLVRAVANSDAAAAKATAAFNESKIKANTPGFVPVTQFEYLRLLQQHKPDDPVLVEWKRCRKYLRVNSTFGPARGPMNGGRGGPVEGSSGVESTAGRGDRPGLQRGGGRGPFEDATLGRDPPLGTDWGFGVQDYARSRLVTLASTDFMEAYTWNSGGKVNGKNWHNGLPTDAHLLMDWFFTFISDHSMQSLVRLHFADFSNVQESNSGSEQQHPHVRIIQWRDRSLPPYYSITFPSSSSSSTREWLVQPGPNNVFATITLFLYFIIVRKKGVLGRILLSDKAIGNVQRLYTDILS